MNAGIQETTVVDKVLAGERITAEEALELYQLPLQELGALADHRRNLAKMDAYDERGNEIVTYIVERNINYTNVCNVYCKFCAFYRTERDSDHYVLSHEQIDQKIDELVSIGGLNARRTSSEARHRILPRFVEPPPRKVSASECSRIQPAGI